VPIVRTRHISGARAAQPVLALAVRARAARIVTTGEALKRELVDRNGFTAARIESVPTGIDAGRFRPWRPRRDAGETRSSRGCDAPWHRGDAAQLEGARIPVARDAHARAQRAPRHRRRRADARGTRRKIGRLDERVRVRVRMAGDQRDVLPWLQALDLFALPSYANEGVPAGARAGDALRPALRDYAGRKHRRAGADEVTALVVPARDTDALAAAIARLAGDAALRKELGIAARRHCVENFSYERMLDRMEAIYHDVAKAAQS
jgi:glycosyltransferase involved in cell wall biosynthesis